MRSFIVLTLAAAMLAGCGSKSASAAQQSRDSTAGRDTVKADSLKDTTAIVRALYVNRWRAQSWSAVNHFIRIADSTEINALVIDMKDEFGLNYRTSNPDFAKNAGTSTKIPKLTALLDSLKAHHILPIARMVVFKDSVTARVHPDWTIRKADGTPWHDKQGLTWVNPYEHGLWDYNIGVAEELVKLGFGEIQFDYIRFPEPYPTLPKQVFPDSKGVEKPDALAAFLKEARGRISKLGVRTTADVFGFVTTDRGPLEVGQWWEKLAPNADVLLPMVYPSHFPRGSLGIDRPNSEPYKIIKISIDSARVRDSVLHITEREHVRPWIQAFTLPGWKPVYGPDEIKAQKQAIYDAGYEGWTLWSAGSHYDSFIPALEKTLEPRAKRSKQ
jgi:hypothetical protein